MQEIQWDNTMSVNVESLDAQHKALFAIINELGEAMKSGITNVAIGSALSKLIVYTQNHFEYEENCMAVACFAKHEEHKCEHAGLMKKVKALEQEYLSGKTNVAEEVMKLLQQWLLHHIMKTDKEYSSHLVQSGVQ
jgi:hemerythrin-like metal-binding protein